MIQTRCHRGAEIARLVRFSEGIADGIYSLDEHWNGNGKPAGLIGDVIPVYARIALLSQVIDVFRTDDSREAALDEVRARAGQWFDPILVSAFERIAQSELFWTTLESPEVGQAVFALEPGRFETHLDEDWHRWQARTTSDWMAVATPKVSRRMTFA